MLTSSCRTLGALTLIGLAGCGDDAPAAEPQFSVHSSAVKGGLLLSVVEHRANVWVVGGRPGATLVATINGEMLTPKKNPGVSTAWWVCGLGKDVAVVGDDGLILLQDGDDFQILDLGIQSTLYGCVGKSRDDFWVVGGDPFLGPPELVHVIDGKGRAPELDIDLALLPKVFFKVAQFGEALVVVGDDGAVLMSDDGAAWSLSNVGEDEPVFTVSGNGVDDFWVVGGRVDALAYHYDGKRFAKQSPKQAPGLFGVAVAGQRVLAAGHAGVVFERIEDEWVKLPALTDDTLHAVWQDESGHAWSVGGNVFEPSEKAWRGVVLKR